MKPATIQGSAHGYGPSKVRLVILVLLGVGLAAYCCTSVHLYHYDPEAFPVSNIVVSATLGTIDLLALAWLASVKVWLCADGIRYRSLLGLREMRWDMVEKFYCIGRPGRIVPYIHLMNLIPLGPYYRFKLIDSEGSRISFGNRIGRAADAGVKLVEYTYNPLFEKASSLLRTGTAVDFGAIVVDIASTERIRIAWALGPHLQSEGDVAA